MIGKLETYLLGFGFQLVLLGIFSFRSRFCRFEKQFALDFIAFVAPTCQASSLRNFRCPMTSCWTSYRASVLTLSIRCLTMTAGFSKIVFNRS